MKRFKNILARMCKNERGAALIEFIFVSPFIILLVLGSVELTRYVLIVQKVDKSVYTLADILAQSDPATKLGAANELSAASLNTIFNLYDNMTAPFDAPNRQVAIATSIQRSGANNVIRWQAAGGGTLSDAAVRSIANGRAPAAIGAGVKDTNATFPAPVAALLSTMTNNENMVMMEIFYRYEPFLSEVLEGFGFEIEPAVIARRMYMRPRNGTGELIYLPPTFPVP
jgi:Flp pilus assembly protein TadG